MKWHDAGEWPSNLMREACLIRGKARWHEAERGWPTAVVQRTCAVAARGARQGRMWVSAERRARMRRGQGQGQGPERPERPVGCRVGRGSAMELSVVGVVVSRAARKGWRGWGERRTWT